jgi:uncharacterized membrane protein YbhN (UPF0104 family)
MRAIRRVAAAANGLAPQLKMSRKWLSVGLKLAVLGLLVWAIRRTLVDAWAEISAARFFIRPEWLVVSGVLYLVGMMPCGWFWHRVLVRLGQRPTWLESQRAYFIGHLGKYVPGKALVVILRAGLVRGPRVDVTVAAASVFVETLTQMAVGAFIAALILVVMFHDQTYLTLLAVGLMVVAALPTHPAVFVRLVRMTGLARYKPQAIETLEKLDSATVLAAWPMIALGWFVIGGSLWATLRAIGVEGADFPSDLLRLTAVASLAVVAGFLSLIPGGLGVRDLVLTTLLAPHLAAVGFPAPQGTALAAAVLLRVVWLIAEVLLAAILYPLRPHRISPAPPA